MNKTTVSILSLLFFSKILCAQYFLEYQDSAHIDHLFDATASLGGGAAFFDYDNDGDDDLYITAGNDRDHFYINNGDGTFTYNSIGAGFVITKLYYTTGVIAGDIDNDGYKDLFVTTWYSDFEPGGGKNLLFKNNGDGTFTEIWNNMEAGDKVQTMGATFIDYDLDGLLDIYTANYVDEVGFVYDDEGNIIEYNHTCYRNNFYHNMGNGEFQDEANTLNLFDNGCALAVTASDFDMDGDMDIYIANDFGEFILPNQLFQFNSDNGFFWPVASEYNADAKMYGMGIAVGDIDQDLDFDYYVTNFGKNILLENNGNTFNDITDISGTGNEWVVTDSLLSVSWGTAFLDIDNDSDLDLYVANGWIPSAPFLPSTTAIDDVLFLNNGDGIFDEAGESYGIKNSSVSRGMSFSDYDNDGDLDMISVVLNIPPTLTGQKTVLYNNQKGNEKNWLQVTLEGVKVNRDAYGSKVYLCIGDKTLLQEVSGGSSHASHVSSRLHFGLGDLPSVDSLTVVWTGGNNSQTLYDLPVNQVVHIKEDTTTMNPTSFRQVKNDLLFYVFPNPANDKLMVELKNNSQNIDAVEIYNEIGGLVKRQYINDNRNRAEIKLDGYTGGVYFLKIKSGDKYFYKKIIVQK
ncbi:MAG TPA: T9SS type A sorting domain-containing protein [Bacteroidetes bacterium]|nr:T9SS type A sorting domain-containing protein [Bacteroidota bacterium]